MKDEGNDDEMCNMPVSKTWTIWIISKKPIYLKLMLE